jgi:ABC-type transport system involved in multi-copper enzyme maturation permease subunit
MTSLTMPARPHEDDAALRPLPWRRMAGVTWRQHRIALAGVAVLLGAVAVWLWIAGTSVHHAYAAVIACHPASSPGCLDLANTFNGTWNVMGYAAIFLQLLPALIGAFAGAPVLARELETGTFRFAWTQGFARWRWALAKLVALAVVLAALTAAFSVLLSWCYQPYLATSNQELGIYENSPLVTVFSLREVTFPAWTLAVFAVSALAGMLIRRVVPAIVAGLAVYAGLAIAAAALLREHYLAPLVTGNQNVPGSAWITGQWWTKDGRFAFAGNPPASLINQCSFPQSSAGKGGGVAGGGGPSSVNPFAQCLAPHGYAQWTSFQPGSRFWPFQWIEGGWLLLLAALLIAVTVWLVHRRAA